MANIALFMQQLQGDAQRKKDEQDRLLRDIESSQSVNKVARPIAQLIDFLSNANKFQSGTSLAGNFPKDIDEQRINATLAGYVNPSNDEILELMKMQSQERIAGMKAKADKGVEDDWKRYSYIQKDIEEIDKTFREKTNAYNAVETALETGNLSMFTNQLANIAKGLGGESSRLTEEDINRAVARTFGQDMTKVKAYFSGDPNVKIQDKLLNSLRNSYIESKTTFYKNAATMVDSKKKAQAAAPYMSEYINKTGGSDYEAIKQGVKNNLRISDELLEKQDAIKEVRDIKKRFATAKPEEQPILLDRVTELVTKYNISKDER